MSFLLRLWRGSCLVAALRAIFFPPAGQWMQSSKLMSGLSWLRCGILTFGQSGKAFLFQGSRIRQAGTTLKGTLSRTTCKQAGVFLLSFTVTWGGFKGVNAGLSMSLGLFLLILLVGEILLCTQSGSLSAFASRSWLLNVILGESPGEGEDTGRYETH